MAACSKGTKCIEKLIYEGPGLSVDSLNPFFEANSASLSSVLVRNTCNALLDSFLTLPALEEVAFTVETVGEFPECIMPEDTLKALEKRGIYCRSMNFY